MKLNILSMITPWVLLIVLGCGGGGGGGGSGSDTTPTTVRLSGTVRVADHVRVDGDTNDPNMPYAPNDEFISAQVLPNPVSLTGYANQPGAGPAGRSQSFGDEFDVYRVSLTAGQVVYLQVGTPFEGDLDLRLFDQDAFLVDGSFGAGESEAVTAPSAGTYFVVVEALSGASGYVLTTGLTPEGPQEVASARLSDAFVPGEVVVRFQERMVPSSEVDTLEARAGAAGLAVKTGAWGRPVLLFLGNENGEDRALRALGLPEEDPVLERLGARASLDQRDKLQTLLAIKALGQRQDVAYAEPNYLLQPQATIPNDQFLAYQWHYPLINLPQAWDLNTGQANPAVVVAVLDTGVLLGHPDLQGQLVAGYDFIRDPSMAADGDGIDPNPDDPGDAVWPWQPSSFHGTHVAGTIAAATNNGIGVAGVSWSGKIMPVRVLGRGGGTTYDILQGVRYAAGLPNDSGTVPVRRADVLNLSFGGSAASQAERETYAAARNAGCIVVAAAGNDATSQPMYPAAYDGVVSVSAVDMRKLPAYYSNYGSTVDVAAPGGDMTKDLNGDGYPDGVLSAVGDDSGDSIQMGYRFEQGTSMAAPHVAGVAALVKAVNPGLTPDQFDALLAGGAITEDLGPPGRDDRFGHGLIDAHKAVLAAQTGAVPSGPALAASPTTLNLGANAPSGEFELRNAGGGELFVSTVTADPSCVTTQGQPWVALAPKPGQVDGQTGLGVYTVAVDRSGLGEGTHTCLVHAVSTANTVGVTVLLQVLPGGIAGTGDAGYHYVLLVDPETLETLDQAEVTVSNGTYTYAFDNVPRGAYELWAGTDLDNDEFICGSAEACGAYPTASRPDRVVADRDLSGLDFWTDVSITLPAAASAEESVGGLQSLARLSQKSKAR